MPTFGVKAFVAVCVLATAAIAQRNISVGNPVTEDFDLALGTASTSLTDNVGILPGFYTLRSSGNVAPKPLVAGDGSSNTSQYYNMGQTGNTNRSVGFVNANGVTSHLGLRLLNNGAVPITSLRIQFAGEQWRDGNGGAETMAFAYQVNATALGTGTWTAVPALLFTSPNAPGGNHAWNGDLAANRVVFDQTISVNVPAGQEIWLRWSSLGTSAQADGIAVDDITITPVGTSAGDATISGRVTDSFGRAISSATVSVMDLTGKRRVVSTNTFGYYSIPGLDVGQTYVLGVSARRYTFAEPSMVVSLSDNFSGANFIASR